MRKSTEPPHHAGDEEPAEKRRTRVYAAPRLVLLGNLRDTLGKTGPACDLPRPHPRRP